MTATGPTSPRTVSFVTPVLAGAGALFYLWFGWCMFPLFDWNEIRIAPAFALRHGYPLYPLENSGPLSTWIYGPVGVLINLPVTWANAAVEAVMTAGVINILTLLLPLAVVCFGAAELAACGWTAKTVALAFSILLLPGTALSFYVADHAAIALGILSCWWLVRSKRGRFASLQIALAALCCVLSAFSKQTSVFLAIAQFAFLWRERDRPAIRRYFGWLVAIAVIVAFCFIAAFGFENLWLNLVRIPGRLPWGDLWDKIALRWPQLLAQIVAPGAVLIFRQQLGLAGQPASESEQLIRCASVAFIVLIPGGLLSFWKIGGDTNVFHSCFYAIPALVVMAVKTATGHRWANMGLLGLLVCLLVLRTPELSRLPARPFTSHLEVARQIAAADRGAVWFPNNPLVTFYSDIALYHVEDGIATRHLAGFFFAEPQIRAHLPQRLNAVVYPTTYQNPFALQLLPQYSQKHVIGEWTIYRPVSLPP